MRKILLTLLLTLVIIVAVFVIFVAMQPDEFQVLRRTTIDAPAPVVFEQVNDFHKWEAWSPWAKLDPNSKATFEGPTSGEGAIFHWSGNDEVGEGTMTITESIPGEIIRIRLEFTKPMAATNTTEFTFRLEGDQTIVTWTMAGTNNFVGKVFCLLMNMDKMVGGDFEKGLASMKAVAEEEATKRANAAKEESPPAETSNEEPAPRAE